MVLCTPAPAVASRCVRWKTTHGISPSALRQPCAYDFVGRSLGRVWEGSSPTGLRPLLVPLFTRVRRRNPAASLSLPRLRSRHVFISQNPQDTWPQTLLDSQLVAPEGSLPLAVLLRHLSPRRSGPSHPQDAAQDDAVIVGRAAYLALLRRQQRNQQGPLLVGEVRLFGRDRRALERPFCAQRSPRRAPCGPAAGRHGLVRPPPHGPSQEEASSPFGLGHREHEATRLWHRRGVSSRSRSPF